MSQADRSATATAPRLRLNVSLVPGPITQPILDGEIDIAGVDLTVHIGQSVDRNSRDMLDRTFDVAEMSLATFAKAREQGAPLVGLPIFTGRRFLQPCVVTSASAGVAALADLRGKRIGLPQFWMTSSVWHRGILSQAGVLQSEATWYTAATERLPGLETPHGVDIRLQTGPPSLEEMLFSGDLDALMTPRSHESLARDRPGLSLPYQDVAQATLDYLERTGVYPIMHFVVMSADLEARHPWLATALFEAFARAKHRALAAGAAPELPVGARADDFARVLGPDPWLFGLERNRQPLQTFLDFAVTQGLLVSPVCVEDLFAPSTHQLAA
jgi:4,5-dihydroxyphthalate decarboxylase